MFMMYTAYNVKLVVLTLIYFAAISDSKKAENIPCEKWKSVPLDNTEVDGNGKITSGGITYDTSEVFVDDEQTEIQGDLKKLRGCPCLRHPCIRKCCPHDQIYLINNKTDMKLKCLPSEEGDTLYDHLVFYSEISGQEPEKVLGGNVTFLSHELKDYCVNKRMFPLDVEEFYLLNNGSLLKNSKIKLPYELVTIDRYCVDIINSDVTFMMCFSRSSAKRTQVVTLIDNDKINLLIYPICMVTSLPFLLATCLLYCFIPDLNNLVGKSLSSLTLSRIVFTGPLCWIQLFGENLDFKYCVFIAGFLIGLIGWIVSAVFDTSAGNFKPQFEQKLNY